MVRNYSNNTKKLDLTFEIVGVKHIVDSQVIGLSSEQIIDLILLEQKNKKVFFSSLRVYTATVECNCRNYQLNKSGCY